MKANVKNIIVRVLRCILWLLGARKNGGGQGA